MPDLPPFNHHRLLPDGIHDATLEQIRERFVPLDSDQRRRLFGNLSQYVAEVHQSLEGAQVLVNGSFVMPAVDGGLGPSDIDLVLVLPPTFDLAAPLRPFEYNLMSKSRVRRTYHFHVFSVIAGTASEQEAVGWLLQVNPKWYEPLGLPTGSTKGIVRVVR